jgi:Family of unknown function (DUF5677)
VQTTDTIAVYAKAFYSSTIEIRDVVKADVIPPLKGHPKDSAFADILCLLYFRMMLWCESLAELSDPSHFQAVRAGARAAFELHLDIFLLARDPSLAEKMAAFTKVWKYHSALKMCNFLKSHPEIDKTHGTSEVQLAEDEAARQEYEELIDKFWPSEPQKKRKAPDHWSGKKRSELAKDAGVEFDLWCRKTYPLNSIFTHAGIESVYNLSQETFTVVFGRGHRLFQESFLKATEIVCESLRVFDAAPGLKIRLEELAILPAVKCDAILREMQEHENA